MDIYKKQEFYSNYFKRLDEFALVEDFSCNKDDSNLFTGKIRTKDTPFPIEIEVLIPKTFPHHKLSFWTNSISGYPHLIYNKDIQSNWFCLNTPFAETAEAQLDLELYRLKNWMTTQLRPDLPPKIEDKDVILSLRKANAYSWENLDEILEFKQDSILTFVGDWESDLKNFDSEIGYLHCIKSSTNRLYALQDKSQTNYELPYILVDSVKNFNILEDFLSLKNYFLWDKSVCNHLLPSFDIYNSTYRHLDKRFIQNVFFENIDEQKARSMLEEAYKGLLSPEIPIKDKEILQNRLNELESELIQEHMWKKASFLDEPAVSEDEEESEEDYFFEVYPYVNHYFALGIKLEERIIWLVLSAQRRGIKYDTTSYRFGKLKFDITNISSVSLNFSIPNSYKKKDFFGRGALAPFLANKKVALIGAGALGSKLAEALAREGIGYLGIWDADIVEPGNICRSNYTLKDLGYTKDYALRDKLQAISPFCKIKTNSVLRGDTRLNLISNTAGNLYSDINYKSQEDVLKELNEYDLVIDCTASNELLHFLSYSLKDKDFISLCITNHAQNLLCISNQDGNTFELRKNLLAKIEQDTKNFYLEGTGCYAPTFLATDSDISALVNLAVREINRQMSQGKLLHSTVWSYDNRGVVADSFHLFELENEPSIKMSISNETQLDGEELLDIKCTDMGYTIGYLLGGYSNDGKHIYVSHFIGSDYAEEFLNEVYNQSHGIIDYIGDFTYSWDNKLESRYQILIDSIANKAANESVNTNNPIVATRNLDGSISYYLYMNGSLNKFKEIKE